MTEEEYLNQTQYFSESAQEFLDIDSMVFTHAVYSFKKLMREFNYGEPFVASKLYFAFLRVLQPQPEAMKKALKEKGIVSYYAPDYYKKALARGRMYRAGARLGVKVTTRSRAQIVTGEVVTGPSTIRVRGREIGDA